MYFQVLNTGIFFNITCCQKCCQIHYGYAQKLEYLFFSALTSVLSTRLTKGRSFPLLKLKYFVLLNLTLLVTTRDFQNSPIFTVLLKPCVVETD